MPFEIDRAGWTGEGTFTQVLIDRLGEVEGVRFLRIENAPATRSDADYNFISNELFVAFETAVRTEPVRRLGVFPGSRKVTYQKLDVAGLGLLPE